MENVERAAKFLKDAETYYLATADGDQPRVRPFAPPMSMRAGCTYRPER